ncbi:protein cycle isoform X2 [Lutzomyia longipalpis]|uniref:protein cycle isoform X2 n=1 Tax=Lutzomyia longipalpis TaxID=7200 RepID=UPI0024836099|nr:protein cycle isoform X2 [Lutzomyia longipalpis]
MVARNFSIQDLPYSGLLQVPDEEREFLTLEELKPHQLTELGVSHTPQGNSLSPANSQHHQAHQMQQQPSQFGQQIYFDLNTQTTTTNGNCVFMSGSELSMPSHSHLDPNSMSTTDTTNSHSQNSSSNHHMARGHQRKRKCSYTENSDLEDDTGDDAKSVRTEDNKKQNHSEIEKRRRDKMNTYITELSSMVPICHAMSRKLDKLTVLRMAVQHLKTIRGAVHSYTEGHYKPAFLSDEELKMLILQAAEGGSFLFVVGCDRGRLLYISESVSQVLNYSQGDLLGQSWFDILHPKDVAKVKEQLSSSDLSPRERLIDAKTMLPVKTDVPQGLSRLCPGARRSFFCRMKYKASIQVKEELDAPANSHRRKKQMSSDKKYSVIQCTGYLKSWAPAKIGLEEQEADDGESCNLSCLVAIGRIPPNIFVPNVTPPISNNLNLRSIQFISRHAMDGKFLFVDQRATLILGFLPQELLGTSMYEYYHHEDIPSLAESHKSALQISEHITTPIYRLRTKDGGFVRLQSEWKSFRNPWTKDVEYLIAKNSVILSDTKVDEAASCAATNTTGNGVTYRTGNGAGGAENSAPGNFDFFNQASNGREMHRIINTHVEASKIGRQIAEQVLDHQRRVGDSSSESSPDPEVTDTNPHQHIHLSESSISASEVSLDRRIVQANPQRLNGTLPGYHVRNNSIINANHSNTEVLQMMTTPGMATEAPNQTGTTDGNDEAAMAVIMSLLEADAGLGGPVDFTGLPWPLP